MECLALWKAPNTGNQLYTGSGQPALSIQFLRGTNSSYLNSLGSIPWCCLTWHTQPVKPFTIMTSLSLILEELEALLLGANLTVQRWSLMCINHIDMAAHTPAIFTKLGTTHIYVEFSTAEPRHVSHHGAMPAEWSPIHALTRFMIA